ncbi:ATP-binding protein [Streptomyces sp. NPDC054802]
MRFTSTPRGARLARRMAEHLLDAWGFTYDSEPHDTLTLIVAELCANAAQLGRVPCRDFHLRLSLTPAGTDADATVRVEVTDTRTEKLPALTPPTGPDPEDSGRGLLLVSHLSDTWATSPAPMPRAKRSGPNAPVLHPPFSQVEAPCLPSGGGEPPALA